MIAIAVILSNACAVKMGKNTPNWNLIELAQIKRRETGGTLARQKKNDV